jgi:hypothetical protein
MRSSITYQELHNMETDIRTFQAHHPGVSFLLAPRIKFFYDRAGVHLAAMNSAIDHIKDVFIERAPDGKYIKLGENGKGEWKWKAVVNDIATGDVLTDPEMIKARFNQRINEFAAINVMVEL